MPAEISPRADKLVSPLLNASQTRFATNAQTPQRSTESAIGVTLVANLHTSTHQIIVTGAAGHIRYGDLLWEKKTYDFIDK